MTNGWEKRASGRYATDCPTPDRTRLETGGRTGQQHPGARRAGRLNERAYTLGETSDLGYLLMVSVMCAVATGPNAIPVSPRGGKKII